MEDNVTTVDLSERLDLSEGFAKMKIDKEKKIVYGVKFLGRESKNGRDYSDKAMQEYANLSEGESIFRNHKKGSRLEEEFAGNGRNKRVEQDGVYGDWHYTSNIAERVEDIVDLKLTGLGMSLSGGGIQKKQPNGRMLIESYTSHRSTDLVVAPATVSGLFEQEDDKKTNTKEEGTKLENSVNESIAELAKEITQLREQLVEERDARKSAEAKEQKLRMVQEEISESKKDVTPAIRKALELLETREEVRAVLADLATAKPKENKPAPTGSSEPFGDAGSSDAAIKESVDNVFNALKTGQVSPGQVLLGERS